MCSAVAGTDAVRGKSGVPSRGCRAPPGTPLAADPPAPPGTVLPSAAGSAAPPATGPPAPEPAAPVADDAPDWAACVAALTPSITGDVRPVASCSSGAKDCAARLGVAAVMATGAPTAATLAA